MYLPTRSVSHCCDSGEGACGALHNACVHCAKLSMQALGADALPRLSLRANTSCPRWSAKADESQARQESAGVGMATWRAHWARVRLRRVSRHARARAFVSITCARCSIAVGVPRRSCFAQLRLAKRAANRLHAVTLLRASACRTGPAFSSRLGTHATHQARQQCLLRAIMTLPAPVPRAASADSERLDKAQERARNLVSSSCVLVSLRWKRAPSVHTEYVRGDQSVIGGG